MPPLIIQSIPNINELRMTWDLELQQIQLHFANLIQKLNMQFMQKFSELERAQSQIQMNYGQLRSQWQTCQM
jgi:hypothetical protein